MNLNDLFPELQGGDPLRHRDALGAQAYQLRAPGKVQHRDLGDTEGLLQVQALQEPALS